VRRTRTSLRPQGPFERLGPRVDRVDQSVRQALGVLVPGPPQDDREVGSCARSGSLRTGAVLDYHQVVLPVTRGFAVLGVLETIFDRAPPDDRVAAPADLPGRAAEAPPGVQERAVPQS
jgi:hypothetical protein